MASVETQQYAEALRKSLMEGLFNGEALDADMDGEAEIGPDIHQEQFGDLDKELEELAHHEVIKNILDQGSVLQEYTRDVDGKLRAVELESIQDYIQESNNMVALHDQVTSRPAGV
eukprot:GHRR01018561.1.p1 GENE.GHRR01018561.1~~GHRR01018561.1.p1  ORF type:complete len:116 (-),score=46.35 GHRR01018561.1:5-352(-)